MVISKILYILACLTWIRHKNIKSSKADHNVGRPHILWFVWSLFDKICSSQFTQLQEHKLAVHQLLPAMSIPWLSQTSNSIGLQCLCRNLSNLRILLKTWSWMPGETGVHQQWCQWIGAIQCWQWLVSSWIAYWRGTSTKGHLCTEDSFLD